MCGTMPRLPSARKEHASRMGRRARELTVSISQLERSFNQQNDEYNNRYLHALFLALDANFRLKRKNVSSNEADPGLSKGWAYIVEETKYKAHLELHKAEVEPV